MRAFYLRHGGRHSSVAFGDRLEFAPAIPAPDGASAS